MDIVSTLLERVLPTPLPLLIAAVPLIAYLAVLAGVRLFGQTLITTGGRDIAALAVAIAGLVAVGPVELFFPMQAAAMFGPLVWLALALLYGLCVTLATLTCRPKLVVYGRTPEEMYEPLLRAARRLDSTAEGDRDKLQVRLPGQGIHLRLAGHPGVDHADVLAFEPVAAGGFWGSLLASLRSEVAQLSAPRPRRGVAMLVATIALGVIVLWHGIHQQAVLVEEFRQWLWR